MFSFQSILLKCRVATKLLPQLGSTLRCNNVCFKKSVWILSRDHRCNNSEKMSQKSITSFFKATPKKSPEATEKKEKDIETPKKGSFDEETDKKNLVKPVTNGDMSPTFTPENDLQHNKRNSKRRRIESSESEPEGTSIKEEVEEVTSPKKLEVKVSKNSPKIYQSPKNKKARIKKEKASPVAKIEESSEETSSPEVKEKRVVKRKNKTPSNEVKEEKSQAKDDSPKSKSPKTKKKYIETIESKNEAKNSEKIDKKQANKSFASFFTKKENGDVKKENGVKTEEIEKVAEVDYNPAKAKYHPIEDACWSKDEPVPYLALAKTLEAIEGTSARLKMIEILANFFRSVIVLTPEDLLPCVYMCLNQLAPAYHSLELGIAETYLMKAVGQCTGRSLAQMKAAMQKTGDLGSVAEQARSTQKTMFAPPPLKARKVFAALKEIANMTGQASVNKKIAKIQSLYVACKYSEAKYLIRSLEGKLRIGLAEQSLLQALSLATTLTPPNTDVLDASKGLNPDTFKAKVDSQALIIKTTYCECPNYDMIIPVLLEEGVLALPQRCRLTPGIPLKPMLAHPTKGVHEVFNRFEGIEFTCEWKYDGERAQIHVPGEDAPDLDKAAIFSRNQENNTSKYPDILGRLPGLLKPEVKSCVLDCEAVAYDVVNKQILPFQVLSTRKRKDANESDIKVQVCVFIFDLLYLNGTPLVNEPFVKRRELLRENFNQVEGEWQLATCRDCSSMEEVQQFLEDSIRGSCEGLMVKTLDGDHAKYDIARRSRNWLKLKKDYLDGVGDTIDVVVIGGYSGKGRRTGVLGGFLLACYDPETEEYQSLCKIGTGFTDEDLQNLTETLKEHTIEAPRNYYRYDSSHTPDVWLSPCQVWEVRCADLSLSPAHRAAAGLIDSEKGVSLRFPRFIRVREDKTPELATSAQQIAEMYLSQDQVKNTNKTQTNHDDFY